MVNPEQEKAEAEPRPRGPGRPRQKELTGFESIEDPELRKRVKAYVRARDARMEAGQEEVKHRDVLVATMKEKKITRCAIDEYTLEIVVTKEKLKVKSKAAKGGDEDGEDGEE